MKNETDRLRRQIEDLKIEVRRLQQQLKASQPESVIPHDTGTHRDSATALRQSEKMFRLAFQTSPDAIILSRPADGKIIDINAGGEKVMGYTAEEAVGKTTLELGIWLDPGDRQIVVAELEKHGFVDHFEARFHRKNGQIFAGLMSARMFRLGQEDVILSITRDITERKRAEEALRESEEKFRLAFQTSPDSVILSRLADGKIIDINEGALKTSGYTPEEAIGKTTLELGLWVDPGDRERLVAGLKKDGFVENLEARFRRKNGEIGIGLLSARVLRVGEENVILSITRDITDRKRVEEALRKSEEKFRLAFHTSPDSVILSRLSDAKIIDINEGCTKVTGYTREEAVGNTALGLQLWVDPADRERLVAGLKKGGVVENLEAKFRLKNGAVHTGLMSARVFRVGQEDVILSITRDITERRRAEEALRESEEIFSAFMEHSPVYVFFKDDTARSFRLSRNYEQMLGRPVNEILGKTMDELFPSELAKGIIADDLRVMREGKPIKVVEEFNGRTFETTKFPIARPNQSNWLAGFTVDITERRQAEDALRESEARYRQIVESSYEAIMVRSDDTVVYANPAAVKLFRAKSAGELIGKRYLDLVHPDDRPESVERIRKGFHDKLIALPREHRILTLDGQVVQVESTGVSIQYRGETQIFGVFRDITARKQAEEKLRETDKKYRELGESLPQVIFEIDVNGGLTHVNRAGYELFGYTPEEIAKGFNVLDAFIPDDRERVAHDIMLTIQGQKMGRLDYTAVRKDGTQFPVGVHADRVLSGQNPTGIRGILIDLTATQQAEQEKKKLEAQLQQAQKMEAIGALAGGIAHDFNNILAAIIGYVELAMLNASGESGVDELKEALKASNRAKDLVKQILAFSRQTDEERVPVRVGMVAREAVKFLRATIPTTIEIKTRIHEKSGAVLANSVELHQIIMNLCTNALHAMTEKGGVLEIEVQNVEINPTSQHRALGLESGPYIRVSVKDTGVGISPEIMERIFDPYFTTKEKGVGTGLGLAVVHGIVKKSGGTIEVESTPGRGSAFHVYLPRVEHSFFYPIEQAEIPAGGSERLLFVDDEKMLADIAQKVLKRLGYDVVSRTSPIEALELFKAKPNHFDVVITDQTMPGMTGDELARELMRIRPGLPVIICTGYSHAIDPQRAKQKGIKALVMKPILVTEIAAAIRKALAD